MTQRIKFSFAIIFTSFLFLTGCRDNDEKVSPVKGTLDEYEYMFQRSAAQLQVFIDAANLDIPVDEIRYDVELYRVTYYTTYKGEVIPASGLVLIPKTTDEVSTISFQHGTIASNREAPSQLANEDTQLILLAALAASGYVTVAPDYIGFGASVEVMHPYYVEDMTVDAVVDNISASGAMADELEVNLSDRLYLAGYSQGGYATMVTHKYAETVGIPGYELQASFPSSGGYDIKGMQDYFFAQETYHEPFYLAYVAQAYKVSFEWEDELSLYFNEPYASAIPGYFDGSLSGGQINDLLTDNISGLLNPDYLHHDPTDPHYAAVNVAFAENSPLDWTPHTKLYMYHGDADITVPYQNSVDVYDHFMDRGASAEMVSFTTLEGGTHYTGVTPYLEAFVTELVSLENASKN